jgi:hypothetical protein
MQWGAMGRFAAKFSLTNLRIRAHFTHDKLLFHQGRRRFPRNRHLPGFANGWREHEVHLRHQHRNSIIANLDLMPSNDDQGQLNTLLLHVQDGRLRLHNLLPVFQYTRGSVSVGDQV